jgi:anti-sigma B factor antagonist
VNAVLIEHIDGVPIARVRDDIDAATVGDIQTQLDGTLGPEAFSLIIDLSRTTYIDSAGIDMLLRLGERLTQRRATLMLVVPPESQLIRLLRLVGLDRAIPVHPTVPEAQRAAAAVPRGILSADGIVEKSRLGESDTA